MKQVHCSYVVFGAEVEMLSRRLMLDWDLCSEMARRRRRVQTVELAGQLEMARLASEGTVRAALSAGCIFHPSPALDEAPEVARLQR